MVTPYERSIQAARGYFELEMLKESLQQLDSLTFEEQLRPETLEVRILVLMKARKWKLALSAAEKLCTVAPDAPIGYIHTAFCLHELGRTREAKETLLDGPSGLVNDPTYHYNLACYECVLGNLNAAQVYLETSVSLDADLREFSRQDPDLKPLYDSIQSA